MGTALKQDFRRTPKSTVTRATVRLGDGTIGHSIMLGRDARKAKLAAVIDAVAVAPRYSDRVVTDIIAPLEAANANRDDDRAAQTAATKVDFFTMVRGDTDA